jgi:hypothetical protein
MLTIMLGNASFDESKENISYFMKGDFLLGEIPGKRAVWGTDINNCLLKLRKVTETRQELCLDLFRRTRPDEGAQRIWFGLVAFLQTIKLTSDSTSAMDWEHIQLDDELVSIINEALPDKNEWKKSWKAGFPVYISDDATFDREAESQWQIVVSRAQQRQDQAMRELIARLEKFLLTPHDAAAQWFAEDAQDAQDPAQSSDAMLIAEQNAAQLVTV